MIVIIVVANSPYVARIIRGQVLSLREKEFVEASRSLGASNRRIIFREILPNLVAPIIVYTTLFIPANILLEAALSFLGVGVQPPKASWGEMLADATDIFNTAWWYMLFAGPRAAADRARLQPRRRRPAGRVEPQAHEVEVATMAAYIARRLVWVVFLLFMITLITFVIFSVLPSGDPAVLRAGRQPSPELIAAIRHQFGLDKSKPVQFINYIGDILPFLGHNGVYFGYSYQNNTAVLPEILEPAAGHALPDGRRRDPVAGDRHPDRRALGRQGRHLAGPSVRWASR